MYQLILFFIILIYTYILNIFIAGGKINYSDLKCDNDYHYAYYIYVFMCIHKNKSTQIL